MPLTAKAAPPPPAALPSDIGQHTTRILKQFDTLPTLPVVALQLGELVHSRNVTVQQVATLMANDPATSAKLLKLVNSPYFGIPGGVSDIARAIPFIGFNTLYQLVLSVSVLETLGGKVDLRQLWLHALAVASVSRELSTETKVGEPGACFTAGLLHDMGTIALAKLEPAKFAASRLAIEKEGLSIKDAEERYGLIPHDQVGAALAKAWRFPATLAVPIERHHEIHLPQIRARLTPNLRQATELLATADHLADACAVTFGAHRCGAVTEENGRAELEAMYERVGFTTSAETAVLDRARKHLEKSRVFLAILG
jgi:HD-like signal output (HDOD) protein